MGNNLCKQGVTLEDDQFIQLQLQYCSQQIQKLRQKVNNTIIKDPKQILLFGNWNEAIGMTGIGIVYLPYQYYYGGGIKKGQMHGFGKITWKNEDNYYGYFCEGKASGRGIYESYNNKIRFQGEWNNGFPSDGVLQYNGTSIEVKFKQQNHTTMKLSDGSIYTGGIRKKNNQYIIQGFGKMTYNDGSYYEGHWTQGNIHGRGQFVWKNGQKYLGDYRFGKKSGYGIFIFNLNKRYQGYWQNGKQNGQGILVQNGQNIYKGKWINGFSQQRIQFQDIQI